MFNAQSATPIYINNSIINNLGASLIEGYIDSTNTRNALALTGNIRNTDDKKVTKNTEDKLKTTACGDTTYFDGRLDYRNELNVKTIYSTFYLFNRIRDTLIRRNQLKFIGEKEILHDKIKDGEYVEFTGELETTSILSVAGTIVEVLSSYDMKAIDELIKSNMGGYITGTSILNQFKYLSASLTKNATTDIVMKLETCRAVLTVNTNYFSDKNGYIYDTSDTKCTVLCRIIKLIEDSSSCCLLRKTAMSDYYSCFLDNIKPYLKLLNDNGILIPYDFDTRVNGPLIQAIPVAMYV